MPGVLPVTYGQRLFQVQSFKEIVWGTTGPATARWMGVRAYPTFTPYVKPVIPSEDRGSLQNSFYSFVTKKGGEFTIDWEYATFEDINFALQNVLQAVSPSGVNPYLWAYAAPNRSVNALQPYTLEWGYDIMTAQYGGCIGKKLTIKGEMEKQWELAMNGFVKSYDPYLAVNIVSSTNASPIAVTVTGHPFATGDQVVISGHLINTAANGIWTITKTGTDTFTLTGSTGNGVGGASGTATKAQTPGISDRTVEAILFNGTALTIDAAGGTPGTTPVANSLLAFSLDIENNVDAIWTNDSKNPSVYGYDALKSTMMLRLLENAQIKQLADSTLTEGNRIVVQLKYTSGSKIAEINFAGVLNADPKRFGNAKGAAYIELMLDSQYDTGSLANSLKVNITNAVSSLP